MWADQFSRLSRPELARGASSVLSSAQLPGRLDHRPGKTGVVAAA
jgi:hypothetical protein